MKNYKKIMATLLATTTFFSTNMGGVYAADDDIDSSTTYATESIKGDVNADGEFNVADVVLLQKWLLAVPDVELKNWKAADLCEDDKLDVFDLCLMKRHLINMYPSIPVERPLLTIVSYDEYEKYVSENKLNEKIVTYNDIKHFGDFKNFVVLSDSTSGDYSKIMYAIVDNSEYTTYLTITENAKDTTNEQIEVSADEVNLGDMRITKSNDTTGYYRVNDMTYNYVQGKLNTISWKDGKYTFSLSGGSMLYDYPIEAKTYTSNLLKRNNDAAIVQPPVERPLLTIVSYDEYEKYVSENKLNEKIVTYNDIKHFGDFKNFVVLSDSTSGDYSKVMYSLIDESGYNVYITISENGKDNVNGNVIPVEEINISDMRTTKSTDISGSFTVNEKTYNYSGNRLNTITWAEGKYIFKLSGASMLYDYPADADTYTSKLIFIS